MPHRGMHTSANEDGVQKAEHHLPFSLEDAGVKGSNGPNESESHVHLA